MPEGPIVTPKGPVGTKVSDFTTWVDALGHWIEYPQRTHPFRASEAIAKGDVVSFVAPSSTAPLSVEKCDAADTFLLGVAKEAAAAGEIVTVVTWGFAIVNIGDTTIAAAGDQAIPHASTSGAVGSVAAGVATTSPVLGFFLSTEIGTGNTAAILVNPLGTAFSMPVGTLDGSNVANLADVAVDGGIPIIFRINTAGGATASVSVTMENKVRVIDAWVVNAAAGGAGDTIQVFNDTDAISDAMDINKADKVVTHAGTIDDAFHEIAAAGTLKVTETDGAGSNSPATIVYVECIRVA